MDILAMLRDKLGFIRRLFESSVGPFLETIRKIENYEEPYTAPGWEDAEPPFLTEWLDAKESVNILGQCCLCLAQSSAKDFLVAFVERSGKPLPAKKSGESWFEAFKRFFRDEYGIDWEKTGVDLGLLEQINLARNDIQHEGRPYDMARLQNQKHAQRFPDSIFANELDRLIFREFSKPESCRIEVTEKSLGTALDVIYVFCEALDKQWDPVLGPRPT